MRPVMSASSGWCVVLPLISSAFLFTGCLYMVSRGEFDLACVCMMGSLICLSTSVED